MSWSELPWVLFLVWTAVGAAVMPSGLTAAEIQRFCGTLGWPPGVGAAGAAILRAGDAVWIVLAATVVYVEVSVAEGVRAGLRGTALVVLGAATAELIGARTGFPFGPYAYTTDRFGWRIGGMLPFTIPLAWLVIVLGSRALVSAVAAGWRSAVAAVRLGRTGLALGTAIAGVLTDVNLEFIAWRERGYWTWYPGQPEPLPSWPPWQNFAAWFALTFLFTFALPPPPSSPPRLSSDRPAPRKVWGSRVRRPALVLLLMNGLFLLVHAARWVRQP